MYVNKNTNLTIFTLALVMNCCVLPLTANNEIDELLEKGRKTIKLSEKKEVVLVLGNTGSGETFSFKVS